MGQLALAGGKIVASGGALASYGANDLIINIGSVTYFDTQQMFLNVFKQAGANANWSAFTTLNGSNADTSEEVYLEQILTNGYPTTLTLPSPPAGGQKFTHLKTGIFVGMSLSPGATSLYPTGNYRVQWQGKVTFVVGGDASVVAASGSTGVTITGNTVSTANTVGTVNSVTINVATATSAGMTFDFTAIPDPANYFQAASCVQSSLTASYDAGAIFHPNFLFPMQLVPWKSMRFMDTLQINNLVSHSRYVGYTFSSAPTSGNPLPALSAAWPNQSGQRRITLTTGEELLATFTTGSTTVTSTTNPTITVSSGTIPPGEITTDYFWFTYDSWAARPQVADFTYATNKGVPYEVCISLCNLLNCNAYLNVPAAFQVADWASFASLVVSNLNSNLKCFVEWGNEVWDFGAFTMPHWSLCKSQLAYGANDNASYTGESTSLMAQQIAITAGNPGYDNTFIVLMPGQAANTAVISGALRAPSWTSVPWQLTSASGQKLIKGVCTAPYIGNGPIWAADFTLMQSQPDGGYTDFLQSITQNPVVSGNSYHDNNGTTLPAGGWLQIATTTVTNTISTISSLGALPIYCYEGSWQWDDPSNAHGQDTFLNTAARDARMADIQQVYYRAIAAAGAMPCQYKACSPYAQDEWGLFESSMQSFSSLTSAPARLQGAVNYVNNG